MDAERKQRQEELTKLFQEHLAADTEGGDATCRMRWLLDHVQDYLSRWIGFARLRPFSMKYLLESDLHTVLILGVNAIDNEMHFFGDARPLVEEWTACLAIVRSLRAGVDVDVSADLSTRFQEVLRRWEEVAG
jgi:hypothetical protein